MKYMVAYIVSTLGRTGPTNQLYEIVKNIDREQFEVKIVTLSDEPVNTRYMDFKALDAEIITLGLSRIAMYLHGGVELKKAISELNPDIIHTSGFRADTFSAKYLKGYRHCNTIHNYAFDDYRMTYGNLLGSAMAYSHVRALRYIDLCISCSFYVENQLKKIGVSNLRTIENGIDEEQYYMVSQDEKLQIKINLGLEKYRRIFIYSSTLCKRKDPVTVIESFRNAVMDPDIALVLLGDGPLLNKCLRSECSNIIFKGRVNNVADYLRAGDIFISASRAEGFPLSVLEAMGAGLPLILSDIQPHREILLMNKSIGDLFTVGDKDRLSGLFKEYSYGSIYEKSIESRRTLVSNFSSRGMCKKYEKLYIEMLR